MSRQIVSEGLQSEAHETPEPTVLQAVVIQSLCSVVLPEYQ